MGDEKVGFLLVVTIVEGTVGNAEEGARFGVVGVLAIALQKAERGHEIALLQKVVGVWQPHFFLLQDANAESVGRGKVYELLTCLAWILGAEALLRLMAETGLAIIF